MYTNQILGYKIFLNYYDPINQAALQNTLSLGWPDYLFGALDLKAGIINNFILHQ